jgi:uncharacterized protein
MSTKIFVNLPVQELGRSVQYFTRLGYTFNKQFTDDTATCMVISDDIYSMLIVEPKFKTFITKPVADARAATEVLIALSCDSRAAVDKIADTAIAAGGKAHKEPQDHGFMYSRAIEDLDGHIWEYIWMDPSFVPPKA